MKLRAFSPYFSEKVVLTMGSTLLKKTNTISMKFPTMRSALRIKNRIKSCEKVYSFSLSCRRARNEFTHLLLQSGHPACQLLMLIPAHNHLIQPV